MMKIFSNFWTARGLVIIGFLAGYGPVGATFRHIGNERFLLTSEATLEVTHSWHHFLREGFGDLGAMVAVLVILFVAPTYRSQPMWWVMLILMVGLYAPFWIGVPFMAELAAPSRDAEIAHLGMAVPALLGCFLAKQHYR
jgi:hypothetical protein